MLLLLMIKIELPFPVSVNAAYGQRGRTQRFKSKKYKDWLDKCPKLHPHNISHKVHIGYSLFFPDNRSRDGGNFLKLTLDYLVSQGVLVDDNWKIVVSEEWHIGGVDKENPRVEITISNVLN